ncbi:hypothetical protein N9W79_00675 [bacterium]|nr:hypothetical protein [bacterium]
MKFSLFSKESFCARLRARIKVGGLSEVLVGVLVGSCLMLSSSAFAIDCNFDNESTDRIKADVEDMLVVYSNIEEDTNYKTFSVQISAVVSGQEAVSDDDKIFSSHRSILIQDKEFCLSKTYFIAEKGGIVFGFESLGELEEGFYSERIGFIEGDRFVPDENKFELSTVFIRYSVSPEGDLSEYSLPSSWPQYYDETEIYLKRR